MTGLRTGVLATLFVGCCLGLVACGGDDDEAFKEEYNRAVRPLSELNSDIGSSIGGAAGKSNDEIAKEFDTLADKARQTRDNLAELDPPDDAKDAFDQLLTSLEAGTDDLAAVAAAAREADPQAAGEASEDLVESGKEIQAAEKKLQNAVDG